MFAPAFIALHSTTMVGQPLASPMRFYEQFFSAVLRGDSALDSLVHPEDLAAARRLGISYEDEPQKYLIGYGFDHAARRAIREEGLGYTLTAESLDAALTQLTVEIPSLKLRKTFLFQGSRLVSPLRRASSGWHRLRSDFFEFWISDTTSFHPAAVEALDDFIRRSARLLHLTSAELHLLAEKKILYVLCRDDEEIERITGFRNRGMYLIPFDAIVTTYSCHYHELLHLLLNFKLRRLPLYTHPFLQEGFAVAFGGRGGIAPSTLLESAAFLVSSSIVDYQELFAVQSFNATDPSVSYALSGLYVRFLVEHYGIERFLQLYRKYSSSAERVERMMLHAVDLPPEKEWLSFVEQQLGKSNIRLRSPCIEETMVLRSEFASIAVCDDWLHVRMKEAFGLKPELWVPDYRSRRFDDVMPGVRYNGVRYLFVADSSEVVVYDLYTNTSLAGYATGFSQSGERIPSSSGWREFWLRKEVLPAPFDSFELLDFRRNHLEPNEQ